MNDMTLQEILPLVVPILIIQIILIIAALADLLKRGETRGPRWVWVLVIVFINIIGPILYFVLGREEA